MLVGSVVGEVLCPSAELSCGQRYLLFVLDWLVCLLVSSCQLPGDVVQVLFLCAEASAVLARL